MSNAATSRGLALLGAAMALAAIVAVAVWAVVFADDSLARLEAAGTIRIGYAIEAPYAFVTPEGRVTGESPEVARQVVARLGLPHIDWRQMEFAALIPELEAGRIDAVAAGLFITGERMQRVAFSTPTFHVQQGLLVPAGNPARLHSYQEAVARPAIKLAVISDAVEETLLRKLGLPAQRLAVVPDAQTGRVAVEAGVADGLALSSPTVRWLASRQQLGRTEIAEPFTPPAQPALNSWGCGAFAFRKEDRRLRTAWNAALARYLGSPEHRTLVAGFGFTPAELPQPGNCTQFSNP